MQPTHTPDMQPHGQYVPDHFLHTNEPPVDYFDVPPPANDNATVVRAVERQQPYDGLPSANVRKAYVRLPRITLLDGAYRPTADNDNREAHYAP